MIFSTVGLLILCRWSDYTCLEGISYNSHQRDALCPQDASRQRATHLFLSQRPSGPHLTRRVLSSYLVARSFFPFPAPPRAPQRSSPLFSPRCVRAPPPCA